MGLGDIVGLGNIVGLGDTVELRLEDSHCFLQVVYRIVVMTLLLRIGEVITYR